MAVIDALLQPEHQLFIGAIVNSRAQRHPQSWWPEIDTALLIGERSGQAREKLLHRTRVRHQPAESLTNQRQRAHFFIAQRWHGPAAKGEGSRFFVAFLNLEPKLPQSLNIADGTPLVTFAWWLVVQRNHLAQLARCGGLTLQRLERFDQPGNQAIW